MIKNRPRLAGGSKSRVEDASSARARPWPRALFAAIGLAALLSGCEPKLKHPADSYQGVVEFDERVLGFEVSGRVLAIAVERGATVRTGQLLAQLDDKLERTAKDSREAEAAAAKAEVALLRAGSRPEDVRSVEAQVRGARASESLLEKNLARERALLASGAVAQASVDDIESRLQSATAERQALEQKLRELEAGARRQEIESAEARAAAASQAANTEAERVGLHELRALSDGTVLDRHAEPGEVVAAGTPVLTVADTTHPYIEIFVPQGEMDGVRVGVPANVAVDAMSRTFSGHIENVGRRTEFTPRYLFSERERPNLVVRVRVRIEDPEQRLPAGVPAFVTLARGARIPTANTEPQQEAPR